MGYFILSSAIFMQSEESSGLCSQPQRSAFIFIHAVDGGKKTGVLLVHLSVGAQKP